MISQRFASAVRTLASWGWVSEMLTVENTEQYPHNRRHRRLTQTNQPPEKPGRFRLSLVVARWLGVAEGARAVLLVARDRERVEQAAQEPAPESQARMPKGLDGRKVKLTLLRLM